MGFLFNCFVAFVIIAAILGVVIFLLARVDPESDPDEKKSEHILKHGEKHRAYVVLPPPEYYAGGWPEVTTSCQVVFIRKPKTADEDQRLKVLGQRLLKFEAAPDAEKDERIIGQMFKSEIGYHTPLRIPDRVTDGAEAYTVAVKMKKNTWPDGWIPQPFFDIKVVFEEPNAGARRANHIVPVKYRSKEPV